MQLSWPPRVDGKFITDNPYKLVQQGNVADIPFVTGKNQPSSLSSLSSYTHQKGTCDDEGTFFSFGNSNITWILLHPNITYNSSLTYTKDRIPIQRLRPNYATTRHVRRKHSPFRSTLLPKRHARITFWYRAFKRLYTPIQETGCGTGWSNFLSASSAFSTTSIWETKHVDLLSVWVFLPPWAHDECWLFFKF